MEMIDKVQRPAPPKPVARKRNPVNAEYEDKAREMVREAMRAKGVTVDQLTTRLSLIGVDMSSGGVANKISRGGFSSAFLLQCLAAMDLEIKVE
ncbi:hypothetical protein FHS72_003720 [Loktanella ponticola]|uniref:DUF6471 domain-containing protein n=1 Tax=Yoonia ponticola TaxID=1524255 RepID=A0A7W9BP50_9RHOB|nr:DUF6471 domain-containing protein [Yoonia ponticola]MBB5724070.1 hypothetical protein [Yoonia ponticola]